MSGGLLLPGAPRTPPDAAKTPGLQIGLSNRLRGLSNRSIVVVRNYEGGPITAEPCRAKTRPLRPSSNLFRPRPNPAHILSWHKSWLGWRRRVLPPGPKGLLRRPFIAISGLRRHPLYRPRRLTKKEHSGASWRRPGARAGWAIFGVARARRRR